LSVTTTTALSVAAAAAIYSVAAAKGNAAIQSFATTAGAWPANETGPQAEASATPASSAMQAFINTLTDTHWPASAVVDVHALIDAVGAVEGDLVSLSAVDAVSASTWSQTFIRDATSVKTDANLVRHDLGLPSSPT
jgi:hypothetical protein